MLLVQYGDTEINRVCEALDGLNHTVRCDVLVVIAKRDGSIDESIELI